MFTLAIEPCQKLRTFSPQADVCAGQLAKRSRGKKGEDVDSLKTTRRQREQSRKLLTPTGCGLDEAVTQEMKKPRSEN